MSAENTIKGPALRSLNPQQILTKLDLDRPGLDRVRQFDRAGEHDIALRELLTYYRAKHPRVRQARSIDPEDLRTAEQVVHHIFQWGPYEPINYGPQVDWDAG